MVDHNGAGGGPRIALSRAVSTRASMRKVAERADVAISSVSRVLSGHPDVSPRMRERVLAAVAELEYEPDFLAQSLRRGQTLSVGFVLADISNPLLADIVLGAETELRGAGYSLLLMNSENDPALDVRSIRFLQTRRVDGMLLSVAGESDPALLETLEQLKVPLVMVDREVPERYGASSVHNDHASGMAVAVLHLLALGHRRVALIGGSRDTLPGRAREDGLHRAITECGEEVEVSVLAGPFSPEHGADATLELLDQERPPTAIVCGSNQLLVGCLRALNSRGVKVGSELSLVTCDDVPASELYQPPIASISRDTVGLGRVAAELLLRRLRDGADPETVMLPTRFTPTASCAPPPAE
ncbi:LacI family DNA-binding transcriptional regulator [soil metagenome]